jgi:hypothetical protein
MVSVRVISAIHSDRLSGEDSCIFTVVALAMRF